MQTKRVVTTWIAGAMLVAGLAGSAAAQLRVVTYNIAQLNGNQTKLQAVLAALNDDDIPGFAMAPHVIVFQEVENADIAFLEAYLNASAPPGVTYARGTYTNNGEDCCAGAQAMFYRSDMLTEQVNQHKDIFTQAGRYADRWRLRVLGYTGDDAKFYVYSAHLKAGTTSSDEADRDAGAQAIRADADSLPEGTHILYMGDFNLKSNTEAAYQTFIAAGPGKARDALGTGSWAGPLYAIEHTQSPRLNGGGLTGGGMDDRFDFQLTTAEFRDGEGYSYITGTYRSFGNDGLHYNLAIDDGDNFYYPNDLTRSNTLASNLRGASDHIPVIAEYQLPAWMDANMPADFGRVIQNTAYTIPLHVWNAAPVVVQEGADELDYTSVISGAISGTCAGTHLALDPPDTCDLTVDTSALGVMTGTVDLSTASQGAANAAITLNTTGHIVAPSRPSFNSASDVTATTVAMVVTPDTGVVNLDVLVHNRAFDADTATLDIDAVSGLSAPFAFASGLQTGVGSTPATLSFTFDSTGAGTADYTGVALIDVSDEDIPGASASQMSLTWQVFSRELAGDVDGDCSINLTDLGTLLSGFGSMAGDAGYLPAADFDNSGAIDLTDLGLILAGFGTSCTP